MNIGTQNKTNTKEKMMKPSSKTTIKHDLKMMDLAIGNWQLEGQRAAKDGDAELARQYAKDVEDLQAFRDAVAQGDFDAAGELADAMDTLLRDQIPVRLYHTVFPNR
jgi:hypothetical protein